MLFSRYALADLLTAMGAAMGASNARLASAGAPALLREFKAELDLQATVEPLGDDCGLTVAKPSPHLLAVLDSPGVTLKIEATYIAAPSLEPVPPAAGRVEGP